MDSKYTRYKILNSLQSKFVDRACFISQSKYLWLLITSYVMAFIFSNLVDSRTISIFNFNTGAGALIFPFTYLLADVITEVYGYKNARFTMWIGFFIGLIILVLEQTVTHLFIPEGQNNMLFDAVVKIDSRTILASLFAYLMTESFNSFLLAKLKISCAGKFMGLRFLLSTFIVHLTNATIFCYLNFYGIMSNINLFKFILSSWVIMSSIEILLVPMSIRFAKKIKHIEQIDIYDDKTSFNIFKLDNSYDASENKFRN